VLNHTHSKWKKMNGKVQHWPFKLNRIPCSVYVRVEVHCQVLSSALDTVQWSGFCTGHFVLEEEHIVYSPMALCVQAVGWHPGVWRGLQAVVRVDRGSECSAAESCLSYYYYYCPFTAPSDICCHTLHAVDMDNTLVPIWSVLQYSTSVQLSLGCSV